jgi:hypothetical protein
MRLVSKKFLRGLGYFLVYTTPIPIIFLLWAMSDVILYDFTIHGLTGHIFLTSHINSLYMWFYSWFWNDGLNFFYSFPAIYMLFLKLLFNYFLGRYLISNFREV